MQAEIIAAGSEMLTPERVDTNSLWLTQRLNDLGVEVTQKSIIGDDRDRLADAVRAAIDRSPIIVLTGGLGPTEDDVTREAVAQALNAYFSRMTHTVHQHGGTLDKFIGDAVMAFWNAPLPNPRHADRALACALAMQADMVDLRALWRGTPFAQVQLRIGLHTGEAAVGHLGSRERFTYTAVGDAVNTAARLEGANKAFGT
ncbi:MAG TPA: molybdopterin-binding protein, partial [Bryobacteraceae bacterium]|nr:molybdopterin-binding protein [Bryobacteraceae bacterium]